MSMAFVDWSSAGQCGWWDGAPNTSSIPLVRPGSNIMLRLLTLTFSQPGYRLLMLTETAGQRASTLDLAPCPPSQALPSVLAPPLLQAGLCVCLSCRPGSSVSQGRCVDCLLHLPHPFLRCSVSREANPMDCISQACLPFASG